MLGAKKWKLSGRWQKGVDFFFFHQQLPQKKKFPTLKKFFGFWRKKNFGLFWSRVVFFQFKTEKPKIGAKFFLLFVPKKRKWDGSENFQLSFTIDVVGSIFCLLLQTTLVADFSFKNTLSAECLCGLINVKSNNHVWNICVGVPVSDWE